MDAMGHLTVWKHPENYGGFSPDGDFVILTQHRDSEALDRSNWICACEVLHAEPWDNGHEEYEARPQVYHWRASHWAVGWIEYLMIRADALESVLSDATRIVCDLADYPVLDEDHFSNLEFEESCEHWEQCSVRDRVEIIQHKGQNENVSIFAARRDEMPLGLELPL